MNINKSKVALGTLLVFALGVFAGAFGANIYFKHRIEQLFSQSEPPPVVHLFMKRLSNKLDLTDTQRREIEEIVRQSHQELRQVRSTFRPEIETIMNKTFAEIEQKLDEKQQQQLKEFRKRFRFSHGRKRAYRTQSSKSLDRITQRFLTEVDEELALSVDQRPQVHEIVENHLEEMREAFKETQSGRQAGDGDLRASLGDLNRETESRLRAILTEEQVMAYKRLWDEQRREFWGEVGRRRQGRNDKVQP